MSDPPTDGDRDEGVNVDEELRKTRRLIASVEELRALLAPLSPDERERVLALARQIAEDREGPAVDQ